MITDDRIEDLDLATPQQEDLSEVVARLFPDQRALAGNDCCGHGQPLRRRKKLWEVSACCHCAIIGTCLPMADLRRLARRAGIEQWNAESEYALHHAAVGLVRERNALSELVQKDLESRYALAVRRFAQCRNDDHLRALWKQALAQGDVAGPVWALMSHPYASASALQLAFEEVHMLSHQAGTSSRADLRRLGALEDEALALRQQLQRQREKSAQKLAEKDQALGRVEKRAMAIPALQSELSAARVRLRELSSDAVVRAQHLLHTESARARRAEALAQSHAAALAQSVERCKRLEGELRALEREGEIAEAALQNLLPSLCDGEAGHGCAERCAGLAGRRVLCVGGRTACVEHYRALIERSRGGFVHHDGGLEHSAKRLHAQLAAADAVICVAAHVSHGAYYVVKRFCREHGKPCVLLKSAGLSSFLAGIHALTRGAVNGADLAGSAIT